MEAWYLALRGETRRITMGFLGRLFGQDSRPPRIPAPSRNKLAMVLLSEARLPELAPLVAAFEQYSEPGEHLEAGDEPAETQENGVGVLPLRLSTGETVMLACLPMPIPGDEVAEGFRRSLRALLPEFSAPSHAAHLIAMFRGLEPVDDLTTMSRFTALLAAVAEVAPSVGVHFGSVGVTHPTEYFLRLSRARENVARIILWNGVSVAQLPGGELSLLSTGMTQLGLPDLLLESRRLTPTEAVEYMFDLLLYLTNLGRALHPHETVGRSADEHLRIDYVRSPIDRKLKVWRVRLP